MIPDLNLMIWNSHVYLWVPQIILSISPCLSMSRTTYMSGRGITASTTSTPRQTQTHTMPRGGSSLPTLVGWWFANIPTSLKRAKNWSFPTWRPIKWLCSRDGEQITQVCFGVSYCCSCQLNRSYLAITRVRIWSAAVTEGYLLRLVGQDVHTNI